MLITPPFNKEEICQAIDTVGEWHGGQGSAFYSLTSTRTIHSEQHRQDCLDELREVRGLAKDAKSLAELASVEALIKHAQVKVPVCTYEEWAHRPL
jgi:hypothetical protein